MPQEHQVRKHKNGFIVKSKLPFVKKPIYLNWWDGVWQKDIEEACVYPSRDLAEAFYKMRRCSEARWGELHHLALTIAGEVDSEFFDTLLKRIETYCPQFLEEYNKSKISLRTVLNARARAIASDREKFFKIKKLFEKDEASLDKIKNIMDN